MSADMNLKDHIRSIPDFPKPGILFYDISTLLADAKAWHLWLTGPKGQAAIASFKIDGEQLFFGDAK